MSHAPEPINAYNPPVFMKLHRPGMREAFVAAVLIFGVAALPAQSRTFAGRLSPMPLTVAMQAAVSGQGSMTAVLEGDRLTVAGTFAGLRSPATIARLHMAARGIRGPAIADLVIARSPSGTLKGVVELSDRERQALDKSSLYIQIHSEKAPEGNLWGWLLPQEVKR
jgi:hypothetical protein